MCSEIGAPSSGETCQKSLTTGAVDQAGSSGVPSIVIVASVRTAVAVGLSSWLAANGARGCEVVGVPGAGGIMTGLTVAGAGRAAAGCVTGPGVSLPGSTWARAGPAVRSRAATANRAAAGTERVGAIAMLGEGDLGPREDRG